MNGTLLSSRARLRLALLGPLALAARWLPSGASAANDATTPAPGEPLTLVVGGLDTRQPDQPENSDVLMIARVDLAQKTVRAVSIPRDLYVQIPGIGYDKITRAYDFGSNAGADTRDFAAGAALVESTIQTNFGLQTHGAVMTNFGGLAEIVDAFGGIEVANPYDVYDSQYPTEDYGVKEIFFPAGQVHLSGTEALEFSRTRHQDGDDGRVMRQHLVLRALLERARSPKTAPQLTALYKKHRKSVQTSLSKQQQLGLVLAAPSFSNDSVAFTSLINYVSPGSTPEGMWIYSGDWSQIPAFVEGFLAGTIQS
ncbi:MAG: LCP family protein [Thermomicrobiales bacterium]